jgi:DNA-binding response OmpR family regulator
MQEQQELVVGPFRLDLRDERLWRGHEAIPLPPKTFAVLCCLVTQGGQLVTKDALFEAVWPETPALRRAEHCARSADAVVDHSAPGHAASGDDRRRIWWH